MLKQLTKEIAMNRMAWRWTVVAAAMTLALGACTITSSDDDDEDAGTSGSGGSSGAAGTGGATGGTAGSAGTAGTSGTAGSAGGTTDPITCEEAYPGTDTCSTCLVDSCCTELENCFNEEDTEGNPISQCYDSWACLTDNCTGDNFEDCASTCDDGNFNTNYNTLVACLSDNCYDNCTVTEGE